MSKRCGQHFPVREKQMASKQVKRCRTSPGIRKRLIAIRHITLHGWRRGGGWNCQYAQVWSLEEGKAAENRPLLDSPLRLAWPAQVLERLALSQKTQRPSLCSQGVSAGPLLPLWPPVCHAHHWRCSWGDWRPASFPRSAPLAVVFLGLASYGVDATSCWAVPLGFRPLCKLMAGAGAALHN